MPKSDKNIWYFHPYAGGPDFGNSARAFNLAKAWLKAGCKVTIFCAEWHHLMGGEKSHSGAEVLSDVNYCFVPARRYVGNGLGRLLNMFDYCYQILRCSKQYLKKFGRPDLIIVSSPHPYSFLIGYYLSRLWGVKIVFEVRDLWPLSLIELAGLSKWHPLVFITGWIERFAYKKADWCVSLLPNAKEYMIHRGLQAHKFTYIPNGVLSASSVRKPLSSKVLETADNLRRDGRFVVIYPGAMGPPNNMMPLIQAAEILANTEGMKIQFILMGSGQEIPALQAEVFKRGLKTVHFFPPAERNIALQLMQIASAGYVSVKRRPIYQFGISFNKLFEYMQQKLPVIFAAEVPLNPVEMSGCGVVTSPDDPVEIAKSIRDLHSLTNQKLKKMGCLGFDYVEAHHDYDVLAGKYIELINSAKAT